MSISATKQVRSFNRTVIHRIGVLNENFLGRERPIAEARLLFEIDHEGADLRELRERLSLDSGYLSRLIRSLEHQKLLKIRPSVEDRRVKRAKLTAKGRKEVDELDQRSEQLAASLLAALNDNQQQRLVMAMSEVECLMKASAVQIIAENPQSDDAVWCLKRYFQELSERFDTGFDPDVSNPANAEDLIPPNGVFLIARLDGRPIGCGVVKVLTSDIAEVKRMWVSRENRGLGLGRRILSSLEDQARQLGVGILRLETNQSLKEAQALYSNSGYREVDPFNDETYAHHWFEKTLP